MFSTKLAGFVAVLFINFSAAADAQDIAGTQRLLSDIQQKLGQIRMLLPALEEDAGDAAPLTAVLTTASEDLRELRGRMTEIEKDLFTKVTAGFADLPVHRDTVFPGVA